MRAEYEEIVRAGFILQIDCPDLAMGRHSRFKHMDDAQFLRCAEHHVDVLNQAVAKIPADRIPTAAWGHSPDLGRFTPKLPGRSSAR